MTPRYDRPLRRTIAWLFTLLAAVAVIVLLAELVSLFLAASGVP